MYELYIKHPHHGWLGFASHRLRLLRKLCKDHQFHSGKMLPYRIRENTGWSEGWNYSPFPPDYDLPKCTIIRY